MSDNFKLGINSVQLYLQFADTSRRDGIISYKIIRGSTEQTSRFTYDNRLVSTEDTADIEKKDILKTLRILTQAQKLDAPCRAFSRECHV